MRTTDWYEGLIVSCVGGWGLGYNLGGIYTKSGTVNDVRAEL
jgi:hypothetical protein